MADIYLELTAVATSPLPKIRWSGGGSPTFPIEYSKMFLKSSLLSGSNRYHSQSKQPRRWSLSWEMLSGPELARMITFNEYDRELYLQNNWEDAIWREVVITKFDYAPNVKTDTCSGGLTGATFYGVPFYGEAFYGGVGVTGWPRYELSITLEEVL